MPNLFSYGTLQYENVQLDTFGRLLKGEADVLLAYKVSMIKIEDEEVMASSGETHHPIINFTANATDSVKGMVFEVTEAELKQADEYEVDDYKRISVQLESGKSAWVYISVV